MKEEPEWLKPNEKEKRGKERKRLLSKQLQSFASPTAESCVQTMSFSEGVWYRRICRNFKIEKKKSSRLDRR